MWLGNFATTGGEGTGPTLDLMRENEKDVNINVNIKINVNADGIFQNVIQGDKTISISDWNKQFGHRNREKYHNELAIRIYNLDGSDGLPTVNGNPRKVNDDLLTGVLFHMGNNYQTSLFDSRGNAYSHGCQTSGCFPNSRPVHNAFMNKLGRDFKGAYYLRSKPILTVPTNQEDNK